MKIEVLIGMIASGKSTYARRRADEGALVICHDDLTQMLHARYRYESGLREFYRQLMRTIAVAALEHGRDVVIDRTHLTKESRWLWVDLRNRLRFDRDEQDDPMAVELIAVVFPIEPASWHAKRRHDHDARGRPFDEWMQVAMHHKEQAVAEPLDWQAEGFDACVPADKFEPAAPDDPTPQPART
jgi:predicted kinase